MNKNKKKTRRGGGPNASLPRGGLAKVSYQDLPKGGGMFVARSALEADALALLEMDPRALSFDRCDLNRLERVRFTLGRVPPENTTFEVPDEKPFTPDIRLHLMSGGTVYLEIGPYASKTVEPYRSRLELAMESARREGTPLLLLTEKEIRRGHRLANVQRLLPYLHPIADQPQLIERAREIFEDHASLVDAAVATLVTESGQDEETCTEAAWAAIARGARDGLLLLDLDHELITAATRLRLETKESAGALVA